MNKNPKKKYKDESYFKPEICPFCVSQKIIRWGFRYNCTTKKRRYKCKECGNTFVLDDGFFKMRKKREMISACLDLYMNGMSLRKISSHVKQFGEKTVSHVAVLKWLRKYSIFLKKYTDGLIIKTSGTYHADEIFVSCLGKQTYFWDIIDRSTRFLVSTNLSKNRDIKGAISLLQEASRKTWLPEVVFTDGLSSYSNAFREIRKYNSSWEGVDHVRVIDKLDYRNNIVERIQGTIRERIKVMRGFNSFDSSKLILDLFTIWYNFIRVHQGIGMTPSEKAGIRLNLGQNKWLGLIYRSKIEDIIRV